MCGICGICTVPDDRPDSALLQAMTDTLVHRGPDGEGRYLDDRVGLGHRRLSIIDLSTGAQPMFNEDRSVILVFNGEIYNYVELQKELRGRGHVLSTTSDTEVIVHLYEDMGRDCIDVLNGMFGFALWDTNKQMLLLARDRLGEKPLYYHLDTVRGRLVFASELKALVKDPNITPKMSLPALDDYLAYGYVPGDRCILEGIKKLPAGCRLIWQDGKATVERYWDVSMSEEVHGSETDLVEELDWRLREAIRIRLRSDVPLGVFLSGGVDSSAIVALASQEMSGSRLRTFSVGFDEATHDERPLARLVAERYKTDHEEIVVRNHDIDLLPGLVYHLDEPFADPSILPTYYVCREARRGVKVCLSGDGGDEVLAGYDRYRMAERHQRFEWCTRFGVKQLCGAVSRLLPQHVHGRGFLQRVACSGAERYSAQMCKFTFEERQELLHLELASSIQPNPWLFEPYFDMHTGEPLVTTLQRIDQKTYLADDILVKVDRMSMMNSLEVRAPFLDHSLVEFVNGISAEWKLRNGTGKYILKRMLAAHLPTEVLSRKKMGFGLPIKTWFRGSLVPYAKDLLLSPDTVSHRWLQPEAIRRTIAAHQRGQRDLSRKIWSLLILELWCREFGLS